MLHPYQCLLACRPSANSLKAVLVAASGPAIYLFSIPDGSFLSVWPSEGKNLLQDHNDIKISISDKDSQPPGKKRKVSSSGRASDSSSAEIVVHNEQNKRRKPRRQGAVSPSVIKLVGTSTGKYIVAVTGEDKGIRVFSLLENGTLEQLSERHMPKKPCSVILTTDEATILCADKFGDVYSLPLIVETSENFTSEGVKMNDKPVSIQKERKFVPAATSLTVHTKRNQRALENQQKVSNMVPEKKILNFDHQLLLGHVSLLIDLAYITLNVGSEQRRSYIITADRDEHIRVSRGPPQAHVIEGYCLGHSEFVSRICIPPWSPEILISGGGDDFFLVWDWIHGKVIQQIDLKSVVDALKGGYREITKIGEAGKQLASGDPQIADGNCKIAICGIFALSTPEILASGASGYIFIICEGVPAIFVYRITFTNNVQFHQCLELDGNAIDIATLHEQSSIIYTMDNMHYPMSTSKIQENSSRPSMGTYSYDAISNKWTKGGRLDLTITLINEWTKSMNCPIDPERLSEALYGIENLRKRGQEE